MEAGRHLELDDVSLPGRIDQAGNGQPAAAARSFAPAEPSIQHGRRRDYPRTYR
jgi:hypothetical protein